MRRQMLVWKVWIYPPFVKKMLAKIYILLSNNLAGEGQCRSSATPPPRRPMAFQEEQIQLPCYRHVAIGRSVGHSCRLCGLYLLRIANCGRFALLFARLELYSNLCISWQYRETVEVESAGSIIRSISASHLLSALSVCAVRNCAVRNECLSTRLPPSPAFRFSALQIESNIYLCFLCGLRTNK